ncbi:O-antigen ligase family protein [Solibacillus sp. MA9]|uniref:O-antigen ligase family protein n=1 Tax=Solibacillus palustris TaxID=2908203 RepID=A0ABS9U8V9_9BACL|nr:O-antigen ligase family protein [Solibacillus sp. MA9]MCH7320604.1 O-antigen ligase family protein [Solibacillus sp. MA9]
MTSFYEELNKTSKVGDDKENAQSRANVDKWIFRLLLLLIGVMPLIVLASVEQVVSPLISNISELSSGMKGDLFTHYKALFVIAITVITGAMLFVKIFFMDGQIRKTPFNYVIGLFAFAIILSTLFSPNITVALNGLYNHSDGAISWLCYLALMFIAMNIEYPKNVTKYVMYTMIPFVFINLFITSMNFYGKDLLQYGWMQKLVSIVLPEGANLTAGSTLVGTLNQWNYMSGMFAMMTVMYVAWAIIEKSWVHSIVGAITAAAAIAVMFMSISTSGFLAVLMLLPVLLVLIFKVQHKKKAAIMLAIFIGISAPIFHILAEKDDRVWGESFGFFVGNNPYLDEEPVAVDNSKTPLNWTNKAYAAEKALELPVLPERGMAFGSGRGYIWKETWELVQDRPLVGYGSDTLMYNFPHFQLESRGALNWEEIVTDKPHNVYVGILYGMGILGFIAIIVLVIFQVLKLLQQLFNKKGNLAAIVLGVGVTAYFIQAMFNDSLPGITTVAFVLFGMMISMISNSKREPMN